MLAFEVAAQVWESYLQDDVTVNLQMGVTSSSNLPTGVIGGALPGMRANTSYGEFRQRYNQDITSAYDQTASWHLNWNSNSVKYENFNSNNENLGEYTSSGVINMTRANAKALGFNLNNAQQGLDGYILLSDLAGTGVQWDVTTNSAASGKLDLLSTVLHEIGHALGFVSGVDQPGWLAAQTDTQYGTQTWHQVTQQLRDRVRYANPLDLFRYSDNSNGNPDLTYGSEFSNKFFSIDDGRTSIAQFASGNDTAAGGDGYQASHWQNRNNSLGVMDPTLSLGERNMVSALDLRAMDVIGWDIVNGGANTPINLSSLRNQALSDLASRIGKSTSWVNRNKASAAEQLSEVRVMDIIDMARDSQVYDLNWMNASGGNSYWLNWQNLNGGDAFWLNWWNQGGGDGWWQMMTQAFQQRGLFSQIDELPLGDEAPQLSADSITGLAPQSSAVVPASKGSMAAPSTSAPQEFEPVGSFADQQTSEESVDNGLSQSYGNLSALALGNTAGANGLAGGLTGLGQDQLQSSFSLAPAFSTEELLG